MLKFAQLATSVKSRYRAADAVTVVAASEQQERTLPGGQGRRSTYDGSIDAPAEAGDEIEGGWRREELLAQSTTLTSHRVCMSHFSSDASAETDQPTAIGGRSAKVLALV